MVSLIKRPPALELFFRGAYIRNYTVDVCLSPWMSKHLHKLHVVRIIDKEITAKLLLNLCAFYTKCVGGGSGSFQYTARNTYSCTNIHFKILALKKNANKQGQIKKRSGTIDNEKELKQGTGVLTQCNSTSLNHFDVREKLTVGNCQRKHPTQQHCA